MLADSLFNRGALQVFILIAGQYPAGGLRDKPPKQAQFFFFSVIYLCLITLLAGLRTPTILLTAYPACPHRSIVCALRRRGGQRFVPRGMAKTAFVLRLSPRF